MGFFVYRFKEVGLQSDISWQPFNGLHGLAVSGSNGDSDEWRVGFLPAPSDLFE